ncbi:GHKL domain-containing protein [Enterococcus asini]|uniref:GHKL domain-containing protein n=1 Tax=Enterococcus asini TaxID=57732 RepID=UPI00288DB0D5|nr:GHKL domain-containing protein [Enterococcus asini]MDT2758054.1 GHKL domain-containing protein [Enterococcus asini]
MNYLFLSFCSTIPVLPFLLNSRKKKHPFFLLAVFIGIFIFQNYTFPVVGTIATFLLIFVFLLSSDRDLITAFIYSATFFLNNLVLQIIVSPIISILSMKMEWWMIVIFQAGFYVFFQFSLSKLEVWFYEKYVDTEIVKIIIAMSALIGFLYSIWLNDLPGINAAESGTLLRITIIAALCAVFLFLLVVLFFAQRTILDRTKVAQEKVEMETSKIYYQELAKNAQQIRNFKHDFQNLCLGMELVIQKGEIDEISRYFEEYIEKPSRQLSTLAYNLSALEKLTSVPLKSLLYAKLGTIDSKSIHLVIEIDDNIVFSESYLSNLIRGLGIILDNALEELAFLGGGELNIGVKQNGTDIQLTVENSCRKNLPPLYELQSVGYSTKGSNRGLGLASLENCLSEFPFLLRTQISSERFIQVIIIEGSESK